MVRKHFRDEEERPGIELENIYKKGRCIEIEKKYSKEDEWKDFVAFFIIIFTFILIFMHILYTNKEIVKIEEEKSGGLSLNNFFIVLTMILLILTFTTFICYEKNKNNKYILYSLVIYLFCLIFWGYTIFFSRTDRSIGLMSSVFFLFSTLFLGWVYYSVVKETIFVFLLLLLWSFYVYYYSNNMHYNDYYKNQQ